MTTFTEIENAVGARLNSTGVAYWNPTDAYPEVLAVPPAFRKRFPPRAPATALLITAYDLDVSVDPNQPLRAYRLQIRSRAPFDANPLADDALEVLHGFHHQVWGNLNIQRCRHYSSSQLGADSQGNDERSDNYILDIL